MPSSKVELRVVAGMLSIVAGILAVQCANGPESAAKTAPTPQLCVPGTTQSSDRFALVHGCITYSDGSEIWAVDSNHPDNRISLGRSHGLTPIAWSRDGSHLLLVERPDAGTAGIKWNLYVMNADGSQTQLTSDNRSGEGSFSPDGSQVAFTSFDRGLYVVDATGGAPRLIAKSYLAWWLGSPAWSPDGSRIAYTVYQEGGPEGLTYEIWTVNPDGTGPRRLVDLGECEGGGCTRDLAWSPDGSLLAFDSERGPNTSGTGDLPKSHIYLVRADGSGLRRITEDGVLPAWSPDGSRIAFVRDSDGYSLFTVKRDGTDLRRVKGVSVAGYGWAWNPAQ